jgi:hypothetical protein
MDYESYQRKYFTDPPPPPRYNFTGTFGITLYFQDYITAIAYYERVLGPPAYVEGAGTRGWRIGQGWLTLLMGKSGEPRNVEITFMMSSPAEAEALQHAFINAGGSGSPPSDEFMYELIRYCTVSDPFGVDILIISPLTV